MANDIITNLHPDNDSNTNLYPNIKKENIPSKSISTDKLDDNVLSLIGSLKPSGTDTSTNILAYTSNKGIYVATDNGYWYYWDGSKYVDGGVYLASSSDDTLKSDSINSIQNKVVYNSLKDLIEQNVSGSVNANSNNWIDFNFVEGRTYIIKNTSSITTGMNMHTTNARNYTWEEDINNGSVIANGATITFTATKPAKYLYIYSNNGGTFNIYATETLEKVRDELNENIENNINNSKKSAFQFYTTTILLINP